MTRTTAFRPWVAALDPTQLEALSGRRQWLIVLTVTMAGTLLFSFVPPVNELMNMSFTPVAVCWVITLTMGFLISSDFVTRALGQMGMGLLMLITSASLQLFFWSWVCFSSDFGAVMLLAFAILTAAIHGDFFQANLSQLWGFLPTTFAVLIALIMAPSTHHLTVVISGGLLTLGLVYATGTIGFTRNRIAKERDSLRAALDAQLLADRGLEIEQTRRALNELRGRNHDAANALAVMFGSVDLIGHYMGEMRADSQIATQLQDSAHKLKSALDRLSGIVMESGEIGHAAAGEPIDPVAVARDVLREHRPLFPRVDMELETDTQRGPTLSVPGGAVTLERILSNLVRNACEGDGERGADRITLRIQRDGGWLSINLMDNGPGFRAEQLEPMLAPMNTTKASGSGLGLYTTRRLVMGSHGTVELANRDEGGAHVTVRLPLFSEQ